MVYGSSILVLTDWVTTHLEIVENLEKSGNSKVVRENEKVRE